jgi:hypothetical protein
MTGINRGLKFDYGYGATPEDALLAVLQRQPAFEPSNAEYIGDKPDFMDVNVTEISRHNWESYDASSDSLLTPDQDDGPIVQIKQPYDMGNIKDKVHIAISNVWMEVDWDEDERADVKFRFTIELDGPQWTGDRRVTGTLDKTWKCERMSTEPK